MCGIIGYVGNQDASKIILEGLRTLEYRGYDSAGIAVLGDGGIEIRKDEGRIEGIDKKVKFEKMGGSLGIGHTRWATHGVPSKANAHPHSDCKGEIALIHNGVIENYRKLKEELLKKGHRFTSETDSEVIAHLIEEEKGKTFEERFLSAVRKLDGSFAILAIAKGEKRIYGARRSSPMVIGVGKDEMFVASDIPAMLKHTKEFKVVEEGEMVVLGKGECRIIGIDNGKEATRKSFTVNWSAQSAKKDGYKHFMLKEINEQPKCVRDALASDVSSAAKLVASSDDLQMVACGSSFHAALVFKHLLQAECGKKCEVCIASEYAYSAIVGKSTCLIAISQSGETADTMNAVRFAKKKGARIIGITNVISSSLAREADVCVSLNAGPEISVVATKTFMAQLAVLYKLAYEIKGDKKATERLKDVPHSVELAITKQGEIEKLAESLLPKQSFFYIGRGLSYPIALEGALKLKEITYLHAEGFAGGELKHGPLSLIEKGVPVIAIAPSDETLAKTIGNMKECKARGARIVAISSSEEVKRESDECVLVDGIDSSLFPFISICVLQLLAYYMAIKKGLDPDKPRNLAKSVTVE